MQLAVRSRQQDRICRCALASVCAPPSRPHVFLRWTLEGVVVGSALVEQIAPCRLPEQGGQGCAESGIGLSQACGRHAVSKSPERHFAWWEAPASGAKAEARVFRRGAALLPLMLLTMPRAQRLPPYLAIRATPPVLVWCQAATPRHSRRASAAARPASQPNHTARCTLLGGPAVERGPRKKAIHHVGSTG